MEVKDWLTAGTALTGAVLGVFNLWRQLSTERIKIRVSPSLVIERSPNGVLSSITVAVDPVNPPQSVSLSIEVLNLSAFPVTIDEVGMTTAGEGRVSFFGAVTKEHTTLPIRVESRDSVTLYTKSYTTTEFAKALHVFAETACGTRAFGESPAMKSLRSVASNISNRGAAR
ncbi:hypothetical protein [Caballeronia sp. INSB1]|uniref:hypothetical protein n=1 Tax=Caballeronia sp. INSB1 TaxID=2921751 RepID=UPI002032F30F|nr:hypothetical protein [Caballeronia sp. INSB1]